jgi:hypothetical protein
MEKSRYIEMGKRQRTCRPDGGDDARTASQAAVTVLVVGEKQHGALEVGAEEAAMLRIGDCSASPGSPHPWSPRRTPCRSSQRSPRLDLGLL